MPILLVFALTAACVPVKWWPPVAGGGEETAVTFTAAAVTFSLLAAFTLRTWVVRTLRRSPARKGEVAAVYARLRRVMFFVNVGLVALCVLAFGWGWFVRENLVVAGETDPTHGGPLLLPFAELAVPLPYFAILFGAWLIYFDAERALHCTTVLGPMHKPFFGRAGYFFHHLRQFALLVMLPVMLFVTQQTLSRFAPETTHTDWYRLASLAMIPVLILFMPLLIKPLLGLKSMPEGPERTRLEALAKRLHFRCSDFLLWPTHGAAANAMIVGLLPRVRYVIFTDRILEELPPDEIDAVFGHEVGHAKHGHIWLYALFLALSMTVLAGVLILVGQQLTAARVEVPEWAEDVVVLTPVAVVAAYIFLVFGFLSRRCERQADVYGCRAVSCSDPNCRGHDAKTVFPEHARGLCPTGIRTFVRALERVGYVNGHVGDEPGRGRSLGVLVREFLGWLKAWQHSTMSRRVAFLLGLIENPARERRFQRSVLVLRWGLVLGLVAALYALGDAVGWHTLLQVL
jgi:Zn-dependent protease with chaperone function